MPYARSENSFADATTKAMHAVGGEVLAGACGVSYSRLRQCANPMRGDGINLQDAVDADIAAAQSALAAIDGQIASTPRSIVTAGGGGSWRV